MLHSAASFPTVPANCTSPNGIRGGLSGTRHRLGRRQKPQGQLASVPEGSVKLSLSLGGVGKLISAPRPKVTAAERQVSGRMGTAVRAKRSHIGAAHAHDAPCLVISSGCRSSRTRGWAKIARYEERIARLTDVRIDQLLPSPASRTSLRRSHRLRTRNRPGFRRLRR
jgi:hypothetical protein